MKKSPSFAILKKLMKKKGVKNNANKEFQRKINRW